MSFGAQIKAANLKSDNSVAAKATKIQLRKRVIDHLGAGNTAVFDAFCGEGTMYREVWRLAKRYVGCDEKWYRDERTCYVADNRRVLRAIDLSGFNVFDLDAYGGPWEQLYIIAKRRGAIAAPLGLVLTEGSSLKLRQSPIPRPGTGTGLPKALCLLAGLNRTAVGVNASYQDVMLRALRGAAAVMGARLASCWWARKPTGAQTAYVAAILEPA